MKKNDSIILSFASIILFWIIGSIFVYQHVLNISQSMDKIYAHPFIVSNTARQIIVDITAMHRHMKDVVLAENQQQLLEAIRLVDVLEQSVLQKFDVIYERYLGEKTDVKSSHDAFIAWQPIRQEVIDLIQEEKTRQAADITKNKGAQHVELLYQSVNVLLDYANNKANEFQQYKNTELLYTAVILCLMILFAAVVSVYFIYKFIKTSRVSQRYLHIIDQNIMVAYLDANFVITELTQELSRSFNIAKKQIVGTAHPEFFFENTENDSYYNMRKAIESGSSWSGDLQKKIKNDKRWYSMQITPEYDSNYQIKGYTTILSDITDKKQIEEVSITDILTKLFNRNYFELILPKEINRAARENKSLSLLIMDIDFFKQYNDTYGHLQGDVALKAVASLILQKTQRSYDYAFRIGGEEFAILFLCDGYKKSSAFAEQLRAEIDNLEIPHKTSSIADHLTASIGMACFKNPSNHTRDEMFKLVDDLLYQAKASGRNQICSNEIDF